MTKERNTEKHKTTKKLMQSNYKVSKNKQKETKQTQ